jgi:hypothetical protein
MKPSQTLLTENMKLQKLIDRGRFATIVSKKDYIESLIKVVD